MVVIADTSPLNYLILIETVDVLPKLYQRLLIPDVVLRELQHSDTPRAVADWAARLPSWIEIAHSTELAIDSRLAELDAGESVAIALAEAHRPNALLLMDDFKGRDEAERRQIPTVGTLAFCETRRRSDIRICRRPLPAFVKPHSARHPD
jgi:predicted nucleic acid-binding protein